MMAIKVRIEEKGNKYGHLTVLWRLPTNKGTAAVWHCKCDCGNTRDVKGVDLRAKRIKDCGCVSRRRPHWIKHRPKHSVLDFYDDDIL